MHPIYLKGGTRHISNHSMKAIPEIKFLNREILWELSIMIKIIDIFGEEVRTPHHNKSQQKQPRYCNPLFPIHININAISLYSMSASLTAIQLIFIHFQSSFRHHNPVSIPQWTLNLSLRSEHQRSSLSFLLFLEIQWHLNKHKIDNKKRNDKPQSIVITKIILLEQNSNHPTSTCPNTTTRENQSYDTRRIIPNMSKPLNHLFICSTSVLKCSNPATTALQMGKVSILYFKNPIMLLTFCSIIG